MSSIAKLKWDVFVAPMKPVVTDDLPRDLPNRMWSPIAATLIYAVVVAGQRCHRLRDRGDSRAAKVRASPRACPPAA